MKHDFKKQYSKARLIRRNTGNTGNYNRTSLYDSAVLCLEKREEIVLNTIQFKNAIEALIK